MFSLGIIFHMLLLGKSPFPGKTYNEVLAENRACNINFEQTEYKRLPSASTYIVNSALDLLRRMLDKSPQTRITAKDALQHQFFCSSPQYG